MKKLPMILLAIAPYVLIPVLYVTNGGLTIGVLIYGILLLCGAVYAFLLPKLGFQGKQLLFWNMLFKLSTLPFVLFVMLFVLIMALIGGAAQRVDVLPMLGVGFLVCYLPQVTMASYGLSGFIWYCKRGLMPVPGVFFGTLAQLIPVAGLPCSIICYSLLRNKKIPAPDQLAE